MMDFTVAIPTYNGAQRLPLVLDRLRSQLNTESFAWEILVVDNNSTDTTAQVVQEYQRHSFVPVRYCVEGLQGAGFARKRAMRESQSELVGFLDDDNVPDDSWVAEAYAFGQQHPQAGAYASRISGDFEGELPPDFDRLVPFFAITQRGDRPRLYQPTQKILPPSAGLVLRRQAWVETVPNHLILGGRSNGNMLTGEDIEMLSYIQRSPWEIWYNPTMQVVHKIPKARLQQEYLLPFFRGIGLSRHVTRMLSLRDWQQPFMFWAYLLNDLRKIIQHQFKYGNQIKTNLVLACEFELFTHSFFSPFYLWSHGYLRKK
ncbi:MAG: glycosyltransferase family 2 protein [Cyanothece sp. SIO2G6]|nr:glycosyltransferase family 2 protein [Cyanothece sp. SIO2G6]